MTLFDQWNQGYVGNFGSFQTHLFKAYRVADAGNRDILEAAYPYWFAKQVTREEAHNFPRGEANDERLLDE